MCRSSVILIVSMMLLSMTVKAEEKSLVSQENQRIRGSNLKESVNDAKTDYSELVEYLQKKGVDDKLDDMTTASKHGFTTEMPVKTVVAIDTPHNIKGWQHHECAVVYENSSTNNSTSPGNKSPTCIVVYQDNSKGRSSKGYWFRINLDGKLEKAILSTGKNDENGNPIRGSGVQVEQNVASAEVRKVFSAEMTYWTKDWLKKQQKVAGKAATSNGTTGKN